MTDAEIDALLEPLVKSSADDVLVSWILSDLAKIAPLYAVEATRPQAVATLERWERVGGPLRKGIASAWLARARGALEAGASKAGELGAKAGAAIEPHLPAGRDMRATAAGEKVQPTTSAGKKMEADAADKGARTEAAAHALEAAVNPKAAAARQAALHPAVPGRGTAEQEHAADRARALGDAARDMGAKHSRQRSIENHNAAYARMGRAAAKFGFKAGVAVAGGGAAAAAAGAAAHGSLTEAQRKERVTAARARWAGHRGAAA
jgi:hypothetical protein